MGRNLILQGITGSQAYGLATAISDTDQQGVFVTNISDLIAIHKPNESWVRHDPDVTHHELGKYVSLAAKCNPTVLELMHTTHFTFQTQLGKLLVDHRDWFPTTPYVRNAYGGYARSQVLKIANHYNDHGEKWSDGKKQKFGRHAFRLLMQGQELLSSGTITLNVSDYREQIFRMGELVTEDFDKFSKFFEDRLSVFDSTVSVLPDEQDWGRLEELVQEIRWRNHDGEDDVLIDTLDEDGLV